jgi:hypothetical protein
VAAVRQQGDYTFLKADLTGRDPTQVVLKIPLTQEIDQGATVLYHIP